VCLDLDVLLPKVADAARELCGADTALVGLIGSAVYGSDASGARFSGEPAEGLRPDIGITGRVLSTGRPVRTVDYTGDARRTGSAPEPGPALAPDTVTALAVPIQGPDRCQGVLCVYNRTPRPFTDRDEALLGRLAAYAAVACRNADMYRQAEMALDRAEASRRAAVTILESIPEAFAAVDRQWRLIYLNGPAERLVQQERSALIGRMLWEAFPDLAGTRFTTELRRAVEEQTRVEFEEYYPRREVWLEVRADPSPEGLLIHARDVSERRRNQALFGAEKRVLELLAQGEPLGEALDVIARVIEGQCPGMLASVLLLDRGGRLRHAAAPSLPAAYSAAVDGLAVGPAAGSCGTAAFRRETVVVTDTRVDPLWAAYRDLAAAHGLRACWSTPILASDGAVLGTFALYYREPREPEPRDLRLIDTAAHVARIAIERHRAEQERGALLARAEAARAEAEAESRAKDRFLATLSHELRNPLGSIASAVEVLNRIGSGPPDATRLRAIITRQTRHLGRLLEDLLDVTRLAFGKLALHREMLDLRDIVQRSIDTLSAAGRLAHHPVLVAAHPDAVPVEGDRVRLEQVVTNLLDNAVKYSPAGGAIRVEVRPSAGQAVLRIRDEGMGLEPDALERIFEPFAQATLTPVGGLGLGLAVVRGLVRQHGGTVVARSAGRDRGSEFEVRLPLVARPAPPAAPAGPGPAPVRRVVVVEDSRDAREPLVMLLQIWGHQVEAVADGERGVERIAGTRPDVALVDLGLPGIDGYEVARRVRAAVGGAVVLVALSGYGRAADRERAEQAGFDRHLIKPVDPAELERLLAGDLRKPS
jgi:PAS domain S-box-containing protein